MKKLMLIALICLLVMGLFALKPRSYVQLMVNDMDGGELPGVTNITPTNAPDYSFLAYNTKRPDEVISTETHSPTQIRIFRIGNGDSFPYVTIGFFQFGAFYAPWFAGDTLRFNLKYIPTGDSLSWDLVIPDDETNAIGYKQALNPYEYIVAPPWNKEDKQPAEAIKPNDNSGEMKN